MKGIFTNTTPLDAYRGAGRPEAIYVIERLMDWSARDLGLDPIELRRRNFIPKEAFPYRSVSGETYDVGDFNRVLDRAVAEADIAGFASRKAESARAGKLRGLGLAFYIESILGDQNETTTIAFADDGMVELCAGTQSNGQGHETAFAQILTQRSGIPFDRIRFVQGDSDRIAKGGGTGGSRSTTMQGNSINHCADEVVTRFRPLAEDELEVSGADLVFEDGAFRVAGTDRAVDLMTLAEVARREGRVELLSTTREFTVPGRSYPNGAHFCEVEIEADTGRVDVVKYTVVDDFGLLINPMLAEGQVHGGVGAGHRAGRDRGGRLRRRGPAPHRLVHGLRAAAGERHAADGLPRRARALDRQRHRHEGVRRGRHRRRARRGDECRPRRGLGRGRPPRRHAADRRARLELAGGGKSTAGGRIGPPALSGLGQSAGGGAKTVTALGVDLEDRRRLWR